MRSIPDLLQTIHDRGGKVTPQRVTIYRALESVAHPTAEAIHERVCEELPMVSLTTVYKTLNELVAIGELRRFDVNGISHFDTRTDPHAEVVCLRCNAVADVPFSAVPPAPEVPDFQIIGQTQTFYGYCARCRAVQDSLPANGR